MPQPDKWRWDSECWEARPLAPLWVTTTTAAWRQHEAGLSNGIKMPPSHACPNWGGKEAGGVRIEDVESGDYKSRRTNTSAPV